MVKRVEHTRGTKRSERSCSCNERKGDLKMVKRVEGVRGAKRSECLLLV